METSYVNYTRRSSYRKHCCADTCLVSFSSAMCEFLGYVINFYEMFSQILHCGEATLLVQ